MRVKLTILVVLALFGSTKAAPSPVRTAMGDRDWPMPPLSVDETFAIGMARSDASAPSLDFEFRPNGTLVVEARDRRGHLVRIETHDLSRMQMATVRSRAAAFRPPDDVQLEFLPRGCDYAFDAPDKATLIFANKSKGVRLVHIQSVCQSSGAEVAISELRSIVATLPQSDLIRSRVL